MLFREIAKNIKVFHITIPSRKANALKLKYSQPFRFGPKPFVSLGLGAPPNAVIITRYDNKEGKTES